MKKLIRLKSALERLQEQLAKGVKPEKLYGKTTNNMVSLDERDKFRIKNEIVALNTHISKLKKYQ